MSERKAPLRVTRELARWRRLAAQGDPRGQVNLGLHYALGEGVRADRRRANRLYRLAAAQGNAVAMHNLGVVYANGRGVRRDDSKAYDWYLRAARLGHRDACYRALDLIEEERVQHRLRAALACLRSIAAAGDVDAQVTYGVHCFEGNGVRRDWPQALHWYGLAAAAGDTHALFNLGHMHRNGHGVPADRDAAMSFYRRAAARGHARSAEWLARCHEGTRREFVWWRRAVALGSTDAMWSLALRYRHGIGCRTDLPKCVALLRRGASKGDLDCACFLAQCLATGTGVRRNPRAARALYVKAAAGYSAAAALT
jgi:uncharacterized protein